MWNPASVRQTYRLPSFGSVYIWDGRGKLFNQVLNYTFELHQILSPCRVSLPQARITTSDRVNMIKNYRAYTGEKLTWLILILLTECHFLCINSCMLFPHLSFLFAQQRSHLLFNERTRWWRWWYFKHSRRLSFARPTRTDAHFIQYTFTVYTTFSLYVINLQQPAQTLSDFAFSCGKCPRGYN